MNWYKIAQQENDKKVKVKGTKLYKGKYPKIFVEIPNLPEKFFYYIRDDVKKEIDNLINEEGQKWLLKLKSMNKKKTGSGDITWLMFHKFKNEKDTYWIDPIVIHVVGQGLKRIDYDISEIIPHSNPIESTIPNIKSYDINDESISVIFDGPLTPKIKKGIKTGGFVGSKQGGEFIWTIISNNIFDKIYGIQMLDNLEIDITQIANDFINYFKNEIKDMELESLIELDNKLYNKIGFMGIIKDITQSYIKQYVNIETGEMYENKENITNDIQQK
ncbi:MAG: hypothetical protein ACOCRK_07690 [bacterium]